MSQDVLVVGPPKPVVMRGLEPVFTVHRIDEAEEIASISVAVLDRLRAMAVTWSSPKPHQKIDAALMSRLPLLEIVSSFGVGYDHVDVRHAAAHGIVVTNTPDVLNEEVADTALGLLLCTVRELPQAMRYLQTGQWPAGPYRLTPATLRNRTVGLVGMGRIGQAIARRLDAFGVRVVYHSRRANADIAYRHYPQLLDMARDVDVLLAIVPGGSGTRNMIDARVLDALGPNGILINMARGTVVDEAALIAALRERRILAAGLDVFANEPHVPRELIELDNVILLPHVGSASVHARTSMDQLIADNLLSWRAGEGPLTPVPETPAAPLTSNQ
jgi:lactate dehydrogenase-like 2-hydroxyacid dehydrogenase